ncbi:small glutamine-rich tetratricopeptide repeat-containing protein isoform X3 [Panicum hallii]|uniref:small glutamine-rich tetratricopeptide repeat-containing protein isoform X3 n=1 Tax=Panicum hallii TaxID=206008 RepID=UPI000DF4DE68|nr:small glutamine-rich tetratricopeptide repeat-containing protein isoform X3 [Panicum hallii]
MGNMTRSDSPVSRRIVLSFLDFLNSVELAPGADPEALEVARDCLESIFSVNSSAAGEGIQPGLLLELFTSLEANGRDKPRPGLVSQSVSNKPSQSASTSNIEEDSNKCTTSNLYYRLIWSFADPDQSDSQVEDTFDLDHSGDELFAKVYAALDEINFFKTSPAGAEDPGQLSKATQYFNEAVLSMQKSGRKNASLVDLAESFKSRGNEFMRSNQHLKAVELYTCAIALSRKNAIYYCNRAAAYTLLNMNNEAIVDCLKSIEIDPNYSKAYSRLGSAYFALGNYQDALYKGYLKAAELDPSNENVRQNIEVTKKKLAEQQVPPEEQNTHARQVQGSHPMFTSNGIPFNLFPPGSSPSPEFFADFINHGSDLGQPPSGQSMSINLNNIFGQANVNASGQVSSQTGNSNTPPASFPTGAAVPPFAFSGSGPEQAAEALRTVMQMFGPQISPHEGAPRGPG